MAKRGARGADTEGTSSRLVDFAEDMGRLLGTTQAKASAWLNQRQHIAKQLTQVRDTAQRLLNELTGSAARAAAATGGGTARTAGAGRPVRRRRRMSAEARRKISEAAKRRWAARRKAQGKD